MGDIGAHHLQPHDSLDIAFRGLPLQAPPLDQLLEGLGADADGYAHRLEAGGADTISREIIISTSVSPFLFMASLIPDLLLRLFPMSGYPQFDCVGIDTIVCSICEVDVFLNLQRARTWTSFEESESPVTVWITVYFFETPLSLLGSYMTG